MSTDNLNAIDASDLFDTDVIAHMPEEPIVVEVLADPDESDISDQNQTGIKEVNEAARTMIQLAYRLTRSAPNDPNLGEISDILIKTDSLNMKSIGSWHALHKDQLTGVSIGLPWFVQALKNHAPKLLPTRMKATALSLKIKDGQRARVHLFRSHGEVCAAIRFLPERIRTYEQLGFRPEDISTLKRIEQHRNGLILITGPTGSGKSTTMATIINGINSKECEHIITIEDPIEYIHKEIQSIITQKELGLDVPDFVKGVLWALRENPDIIVAGESREPGEFQQVMNAAMSGHLAMTTGHSNGSINALRVLFDRLDGHKREKATLETMADQLVAIISQLLVRSKTGKTILLYEILYLGGEESRTATNNIKQQNFNELSHLITKNGKRTLEQQVDDLLRKNVISEKEANRVRRNTARSTHAGMNRARM